MVIEQPIPPFLEWIGPAMALWGAAAGLMLLAALLISFIIGTVRFGPKAGIVNLWHAISEGVADLLRLSPRRTMALAWLCFMETFRRRVWVAMIVFLVILAFAGWFLRPGEGDAAKLYLSFVLTATSFLVIALALFMSVFSLPNDISKKTIFTVATKPVRPSEMVLGRIVGFSGVGTVLLVLMGLLSYIFVMRQTRHTHEIDPSEMVELPSGKGFEGRTSRDSDHSHAYSIDANGKLELDVSGGHTHQVTTEQKGGKSVYIVGHPDGWPTARVPVYGKLRFRDAGGADTPIGINVGDEWAYRSYIEGGTQAAAIWTFTGITEDQFPEGLDFEMTLAIFRTYKGNVEKGIPGELILKNPKTGYQWTEVFTPTEAPKIYSKHIDKRLSERGTTATRSVDLFKDLVDNGTLEVQIRCIPPSQLYGMGQADLYILAAEEAFEWNFAKGYLGIWLQMLLVTTVGVMFSTFLNGPVSMIATAAMLVAGYFLPFMRDLATGQMDGGGPFESTIRMLKHQDMMTPLETGISSTVASWLDFLFQKILFVVASLLPSLPGLSDVDFVAYGYNIPPNNVLVHCCTALGYLLPLFLIGHFILRKRELAK